MSSAKPAPMQRKGRAAMGKGPGKAPKGAKRRATVALMGKKAAEVLSDEALFAFWSASTMKIPPPLRTSFGNYTCLNSTVRFTFQTSTTSNRYIWIPWSPSPVAAIWSDHSVASNFVQLTFGTLTTGGPTSVRPLRMSWTVENVGQLVNTSGSMRVYSLDTAVLAQFGLGALPATSVNPAVDLDAQFGALIDASPDTQEYAIADLTKEREFVSAPASYPGYNKYYDFYQLLNGTSGTALQSYDAYNLIVSSSTNDAYPGVAQTYTAGQYGEGLLGGVPPVRGFLVSLPSTSTAQTLRFCIHRQDGARYPANSLGHTFAMTHDQMGASGEDRFMSLSRAVSEDPARSHPSEGVSSFVKVATAINSGLGVAANAIGVGMQAAAAYRAMRPGMAAGAAAIALGV